MRQGQVDKIDPFGSLVYGGREIEHDLASLVAEYRGELEAYFRRNLPDPTEAEDFAQRVFEKLLTYGPAVREPVGLLRVTAKNLLANAYREAAAKSRDLSWEQLIGPDGSGLDHLQQFQVHDFDDASFATDFDSAVRGLAEAPRDAFILSELRGLTSREAGARLGVSHTTAASRRESATAQIKEAMLHPEA